MNTIQTGDLIFVSTKKGNNKLRSLLTFLIKFFQKNEFNHIGICVWIEGKLYVSEAEKYGVHFLDFENYRNKNKFEIKVARMVFKINENRMKHWTIEAAGDIPYDFRSLPKMSLRFILDWFGLNIRWNRNRFSKRRMICSEYVAYTMNYFFKCWPDWYKMAPVDIYKSEHIKFLNITI